ncbi:hypothetical protein BDK51DRAFT_45809 [Blyttiomyces helicus]|uniref:Ketopantoate reductase PanE/ApbA C terminal-domain-containing protein n=1 Tax=Blyttiomyces helicus TaxID=388810 RepID=A0A4V1IPJ1_9FUNG|nr:hypothetical protein BDK51DRAFT_45809 [Blyttiomyces helicus]|eukprot:RKO83237.1 hypothetical protein BDK51DRAFT_45809 [Blyttiomyces helicus]
MTTVAGLKMLVVGAGAVGTVYGHALKKGDDPHPPPTALLPSPAAPNVSYLLRPKYVPALKSHPLRLYRVPILPFFSSPKTVLFTPDAVYSETDVEEKKLPRDFDMVIVTVPEDSIRKGKWLKNLMLAAPDAVLVHFTSMVSDADFVRYEVGVPADRHVSGIIALGAFAAPLAGERFPAVPASELEVGGPSPNKVIAYFVSGPQNVYPHADGPAKKAASQIAAGFTQGGIGGSVIGDPAPFLIVSQYVFARWGRGTVERCIISFSLPPPSTARYCLIPFMVALEAKNWSWWGAAKDFKLLGLLANATKEALAHGGARIGSRVIPHYGSLVWSFTLAPVFFFGSLVAPVDVEALTKSHFGGKVAPQTGHMIADVLDEAARNGNNLPHLRELLRQNPRLSAIADS